MNRYEVAIVGSGFSGLTSAHYLKEKGIEDICIFEKNSSLGGVWSHGGVGSYPGAACDVQSYTYLPFLDDTGFIPSKRYVSCLLYTSPSPRDLSTSRMPSSA